MDSYMCCTVGKVEAADVSSISSLLKLVSEESRLKILCILRNGEHCVCEIKSHLGLSQSLISHHLKDLRDAGLIMDRKEGLRVHYKLTGTGERITDLIFRI